MWRHNVLIASMSSLFSVYCLLFKRSRTCCTCRRWTLKYGIRDPNNMSDFETVFLTKKITLGWPPWPQGHRALFRSSIGPVFRSPLILKFSVNFFDALTYFVYHEIQNLRGMGEGRFGLNGHAMLSYSLGAPCKNLNWVEFLLNFWLIFD